MKQAHTVSRIVQNWKDLTQTASNLLKETANEIAEAEPRLKAGLAACNLLFFSASQRLKRECFLEAEFLIFLWEVLSSALQVVLRSHLGLRVCFDTEDEVHRRLIETHDDLEVAERGVRV